MRVYRAIAALFMCVMLACVLLLPAAPAMAQDGVSALFINVGKADATLCFLGDQRFLIDTGTKKSYDELERALKLYHVTKLDGVLITHTHKDHAGGLSKLLKSDIEVEMVYAGKLHIETSDEEHPAFKATQKNGVPLRWLSAGDEVALDGGYTFRVLGPLSKDAENDNNNSLVVELQTPQGNMLFTGDMEFAEEEALLSAGLIPQAAVLKVPHHGEDDASGKNLILKIAPQWAVISTSTEEEPDTPDAKVLANLWLVKAGVSVTQDAQIGIMVTLEQGKASAQSINLQ
ncbi:MAG: MBL fold metallo-hydrolase [Clostridia bacterium]